MELVLQAPTRPAFAPASLRLRCTCLLQPARAASSCTSLANHYFARELRRKKKFLCTLQHRHCTCRAFVYLFSNGFLLNMLLAALDPKFQTGSQRGATTRLTGGLSSSKKAWRCLSPVAASLSSASPEEDLASGSSKGLGLKIDLNLPRRRLQLSFTCDACGARSQRLINPDAYARGTVFVQCAGCEVYHKLVDNLGLIEEYDFRQETNIKADGADLNGPE